ncbi:hypothetical protein Droror1_Dr00000980 [Drosera rotundifolia]
MWIFGVLWIEVENGAVSEKDLVKMEKGRSTEENGAVKWRRNRCKTGGGGVDGSEESGVKKDECSVSDWLVVESDNCKEMGADRVEDGVLAKENLVEIESEDDIKGDIGEAKISEGADSEIDRGENGLAKVPRNPYPSARQQRDFQIGHKVPERSNLDSVAFIRVPRLNAVRAGRRLGALVRSWVLALDLILSQEFQVQGRGTPQNTCCSHGSATNLRLLRVIFVELVEGSGD